MPDFSHFLLKRRMAFSKDSSSLTWTRGTNTHPLHHPLRNGRNILTGRSVGDRRLRLAVRTPRPPGAGGLSPETASDYDGRNRYNKKAMTDVETRWKALEEEIERRLVERFAALRDEFDRLRLESDRRWAGFLDRFEQKLKGIVPPEMMPSPEPAAPSAPAAGTVSVEAARFLDEAGNQVEALHRFLDLCRRHSSRVALLVSRGGSVGVWKAVGFSDHGGSDDATRRATPASAPGSLVARVMEGTLTELWADNDVSDTLLASDAIRGVLLPMVVKEKISGALYADCVSGEEDRFDPDTLGFLTFLAG